MCSMLLLPQLAPKNYTSRILRLSVPVQRVSIAQVTMRANSIWWLNFHTVRTASDWLTVGIKGSWLTTNSNCFQYGKIDKSQQTFSVWFICMDLYIFIQSLQNTLWFKGGFKKASERDTAAQCLSSEQNSWWWTQKKQYVFCFVF